MMTSGNGEKSKIWRAVAGVVIVVVVLGGAVYIFDRPGSSGGATSSASSIASSTATPGSVTSASSSTSSAVSSNLLANGAFEKGNLTGWRNESAIEPYVGPSGFSNMTYDANFQTPANDQRLVACTTFNAQCALLNVSTIYQKLVMGTVTRAFNFSLALDPQFSYPAGLQITLAWENPVDPDSQNATIFYLIYQSPQQCSNYSGILATYNTYHTTIYCLTVPQGEWTTIDRSIAKDLATNVQSPEYLDGSTLTLSLSFAGGSAADKLSVGSVYFGGT